MDEKNISLGSPPVDIKPQISRKNKLDTDLDYRALFEQTRECVFIIGLDFKFVTANQQALRLFGYEQDQLSGLPLKEIMSLEEFFERDILLGKESHFSEYALKKKDGSMLPVELSILVVQNSIGMPAYIQMLARDISERKQADKNLKRRVLALSIIGETAGLFRSPNIEAKIPEVLESLGNALDVFCCVLFKITAASMEINNQWINYQTTNFNTSAVLEPFLDSITENPAHVFSVTGVKLDAKRAQAPLVSILVIPVHGALGSRGFLALFDKQNHLSWLDTEFEPLQIIANLIGAAMEQLQYEKLLHLSEMRNRILIDALPDLLLRTDLTGRILDYKANPSHPLYASCSSVIGMKLSEIWPADLANMIIETGGQYAHLSSHWVYGFNLPNHRQTFEAHLHPISPEEALIIVRDITEQARLDQMKSDFISRASHELRTPLTSAILMAELLQQGGTPEETSEFLRILISDLNRQKDLINDLLLAGRLENGGMKLEAVPIDLLPVLKESIQAVKAIANMRNISIMLKTEETHLMVLGDQSGLLQVFINLINNAVKFSPEGKTVEIEAVKSGDEASVSIIDHGLGIPPESIPHMFERFYRAGNVTVAEIPGTGVGLYIVKSIVDELHGKINVQSEVNQGATFIVRLRSPN